ncbi:hypothetical protein [Bacillus sp. P14.5]|uniref:hypothetical protein n=1 Tax=Bacillus sp. P14.5 TaxID=1983400 RepID=UPI0013B061D1|nr:hypothetical protein [Bacillus sp. P14.5]
MRRKLNLSILYSLHIIFPLLVSASIVMGIFSHFYFFFAVFLLPVILIILDIILLNFIRRLWGLHLVIAMTLSYVIFRYSVGLFFMIGV